MENSASRKVPDGKFVKITVSYDDEFKNVEIRGDFFLEPPTALEDLEAAIEGQPTDSDQAQLVQTIQDIDGQLIGFDADDLVIALQEAVSQ